MHIVTTHKSTDFDALSSVIAATVLYPDTIPVLPKNINPNVKAFLSIHKDLFKIMNVKEIQLEEVKKLIVVDTNNWSRLDGMAKLKDRKDLKIILWDHHKKGDIKSIKTCQEMIGATITLMIRQIKKEKKKITPIQATLFLTGLFEDTGNLSFPSTTPEDAYAAAYLLDNKADLNIVNGFLRPVYGEKQKTILFDMLKGSENTIVNGYKIAINKVKIRGHVGNLSIVVQMFREILNTDAAFGIFVETKSKRCIVIGRSNTDGLNIGAILKDLGGGGHPNAGSAMVKSLNADDIEQTIIETIKGNKKSPVPLSDLMSYPVLSVTSKSKMEEVAMILREKGVTGIPIVDDDKLVGIISRRDFKKARKKSHMQAPVKAFMHPNVVTIDVTNTPTDAARLMVKHDIGRLPVMQDENLIGIISRSDLMTYFYDLLPE